MMLIGMALFRLGRADARAAGAALFGRCWRPATGSGIAVNVLETRWIIGHRFSAVAFAEAHVSYDIGRLAMTIGHLGALLCSSARARSAGFGARSRRSGRWR